jgi:hypothetical protein
VACRDQQMCVTPSGAQETLWVDPRLLQYRSERSLGHIALMIGNRRVPIRCGVKPDLVTAGGLTVKPEAVHFQFPNDLSVSAPRESARYAGTTMV